MFLSAPITDFCLLVDDLEAMLVFYRDKLGFPLRRRAPGFADFATSGVTLALWERSHLAEHVGIERPAGSAQDCSMSAVEVESSAAVDEMMHELTGRGIHLLKQPQWYAWNAYAFYFEDPEHHLWEIYAWGESGHAGLFP